MLSKSRSGQDTAVNEFEVALMHVPDGIEEWRHGVHLVKRAREVVREAASGYTRGDLGAVTRRAANASDPWTYESVVVL